MKCNTCIHKKENKEKYQYCNMLHWRAEDDLYPPLNRIKMIDYYKDCLDYEPLTNRLT